MTWLLLFALSQETEHRIQAVVVNNIIVWMRVSNLASATVSFVNWLQNSTAMPFALKFLKVSWIFWTELGFWVFSWHIVNMDAFRFNFSAGRPWIVSFTDPCESMSLLWRCTTDWKDNYLHIHLLCHVTLLKINLYGLRILIFLHKVGQWNLGDGSC